MFSTLLGLCLPTLVLAILADWCCSGARTTNATCRGWSAACWALRLLPLTGLALVALPALDAHTRLLFGRSLAYQVTEKVPRAQRRSRRVGAAELGFGPPSL